MLSLEASSFCLTVGQDGNQSGLPPLSSCFCKCREGPQRPDLIPCECSTILFKFALVTMGTAVLALPYPLSSSSRLLSALEKNGHEWLYDYHLTPRPRFACVQILLLSL
jgi:hypothetical protein